MPSPENPTIAAAIERAQLKRDITARLEGKPLEAQRDVLADLLLDVSLRMVNRDGSTNLLEPLVETAGPRGARGGGTMARGKASGMRRGPGRPKGSVVGGSMADAVYETLKARPRTSISDLAAKHYPSDEGGKHKVRAVLWSLKHQGRATNVETGKWEVTP